MNEFPGSGEKKGGSSNFLSPWEFYQLRAVPLRSTPSTVFIAAEDKEHAELMLRDAVGRKHLRVTVNPRQKILARLWKRFPELDRRVIGSGPEEKALGLLTKAQAWALLCVPVLAQDGAVRVLVTNADDIFGVLAPLKFLIQRDIDCLEIPETRMRKLLSTWYGKYDPKDGSPDVVRGRVLARRMRDGSALERLTLRLIQEALLSQANAIHVTATTVCMGRGKTSLMSVPLGCDKPRVALNSMSRLVKQMARSDSDGFLLSLFGDCCVQVTPKVSEGSLELELKVLNATP